MGSWTPDRQPSWASPPLREAKAIIDEAASKLHGRPEHLISPDRPAPTRKQRIAFLHRVGAWMEFRLSKLWPELTTREQHLVNAWRVRYLDPAVADIWDYVTPRSYDSTGCVQVDFEAIMQRRDGTRRAPPTPRYRFDFSSR